MAQRLYWNLTREEWVANAAQYLIFRGLSQTDAETVANGLWVPGKPYVQPIAEAVLYILRWWREVEELYRETYGFKNGEEVMLRRALWAVKGALSPDEAVVNEKSGTARGSGRTLGGQYATTLQSGDERIRHQRHGRRIPARIRGSLSKHGLQFYHEDSHGAFQVGMFDESLFRKRLDETMLVLADYELERLEERRKS